MERERRSARCCWGRRDTLTAPRPGCGHTGYKRGFCKAVQEDPWLLREGSKVGFLPRLALPCKLLGYPLPPAAGKLGGYGHPFPRADTRCFPILHNALVPCTRLQLKMSLSHRSLQGSAASALLSRQGLVCFSSHTASSPCWAFSSWSHSASSLCFAPPRRAGLGQSQAPAQQTGSSATDLPRDCRQDPELSCHGQVPFSLLLQHTYNLLICTAGNEKLSFSRTAWEP